MPPSTSSSTTRSAAASPDWGRAAAVFSIFTVRTGRARILELVRSPVRGEVRTSSARPATTRCVAGAVALSAAFSGGAGSGEPPVAQADSGMTSSRPAATVFTTGRVVRVVRRGGRRVMLGMGAMVSQNQRAPRTHGRGGVSSLESDESRRDQRGLADPRSPASTRTTIG